MKHIYKALICLTLVLSLLAFGACSKDVQNEQSKENSTVASTESSESISEEASAEADEKLLGTWYLKEYSLMLKEGGTGVYCVAGELIPVTWETKDGKLTVKGENLTATLPENESYTLSKDGKTLTVGETVYSNEPIAIEGIDMALVGTWYSYDISGEEITVLNDDGTGKITVGGIDMDLTWSVEDGVLTLGYELGDTMEITFSVDSYTVEGDTLTMVLDGVEETCSKIRRVLGGNEALHGTWNSELFSIDEYSNAIPNYSITFSKGGTGEYTFDYGENSYSFLWTEENGTISFEIYDIDVETLEEKKLKDVSATYRIDDTDSETPVLTLIEGDKETVFEFYEEEYIYTPEVEVDTKHELGGDSALVGEWSMEEEGEEVTISITEDGKYTITDGLEYEFECVWYAEDGYLMVYIDTLGVATPFMYGNYKVDGDLFSIIYDGEYSVMARKDSELKGFYLSIYGTDENWIDEESSVIFKEADGEEYVELYLPVGAEDYEFVRYAYDKDHVGDYISCITLYKIPALTEEQSFIAYTKISDGDFYRGISFSAPDGRKVYLVITYDEYAETYSFAEINDSIWE